MSLCGAVVRFIKKEADVYITLVEPLARRAIISHVSEDRLKTSPNLGTRLQKLEDT